MMNSATAVLQGKLIDFPKHEKDRAVQLILMILSQIGTDVEEMDDEDKEIVQKYLEMMKWYIEHGAEPNITIKLNEIIYSPLLYAVLLKNTDLIRFLVEHGATTDKDKSLSYAILLKYDDATLEYLLEHTEDPSYALPDACRLCNHSLIEGILAKGVRDKGILNESFALALLQGCPLDILEKLVKAGVDVNTAVWGKRLLTYAIATCNKDNIKFMIQHGAKVTESDKIEYTKC